MDIDNEIYMASTQPQVEAVAARAVDVQIRILNHPEPLCKPQHYNHPLNKAKFEAEEALVDQIYRQNPTAMNLLYRQQIPNREWPVGQYWLIRCLDLENAEFAYDPVRSIEASAPIEGVLGGPGFNH